MKAHRNQSIAMSISDQMEIHHGDVVAPEAGFRDRDNCTEDRAGKIDDLGSRDMWYDDDDGVGGRSGDGSNSNNIDIETKTTCSWQYIFDEVW